MTSRRGFFGGILAAATGWLIANRTAALVEHEGILTSEQARLLREQVETLQAALSKPIKMTIHLDGNELAAATAEHLPRILRREMLGVRHLG